MGYVDHRTGIYGGDPAVYVCLNKSSRFWIVQRVIDGVGEKSTAKILICFGERTLWAVRDGIWAYIKRIIGGCVRFVQRLEKGHHVVIRVIHEQDSDSEGCDLFDWENYIARKR